ncbi:phosphotransferase [Nocardia sp. NPDC050710]|uniref:phosphotransferase n=1 Tax=Nocardia sp. NPDC050710 TaxID=3157220 RepID=UPI0033FCCB8B
MTIEPHDMTMDEGTATRIDWTDLPPTVRAAIEHRLGAGVSSAASQSGGFSHGVAARLMLVDGSRAFVKAIECEDGLAQAYRNEAETTAALPHDAPAPRLRAAMDAEGWFIAIFDDVAGHHPRLDHPDERAAVLATVTRLAETLTPCPLPNASAFAAAYGPMFENWAHFAEQGPPADLDAWARARLDRLADLESAWRTAADGNTLLHTDLRPDNMIRRPDGAIFVVDWAWPCRGAAWIDLVALGPTLARAGVDPDPILADHPVTRATDPAAIDGLICALAGYWTRQCRRPGPSRSPNLRGYQAESAATTLTWLRRRLRDREHS